MADLCSSCQASVEGGPQCARCGALQPLPAGASWFQVLGLPARFDLEPAAVEEKVKELQRRTHPDRFAQRDAAQRRISLEWTTAINDAWRALRDPLRRAVYLLKLNGIDLERQGAAGSRMPPEFLMEVMEQREELGLARARGDLETVRELAGRAKERADAEVGRMRQAFAEFKGTDREPLHRAAACAAALKYLQRFAEEVEAIEMEALDPE